MRYNFNENRFVRDFNKKIGQIKAKLKAETSFNYTDDLLIAEYQKQYDKAQLNPKYYDVQCPVCGKWSKNGCKDHNTVSIIDALAAKIIELYNPYIYQWAEQIDGFGYITIKNKKLNKMNENAYYVNYYCNRQTIKQHLSHNKTIAIYPIAPKVQGGSHRARYIIFDIDTGQPEHVKTIYDVLSLHISKEDIHIVFSGKKGWHITVFFDRDLTLLQIQYLGAKIKNLAGLSHVKQIEIRPDKRPIKLPLSIHRATDMVSVFVDENLQPVKNQFEYFLEIKPIKSDEVLNKVFNTLSVKTKTKTEIKTKNQAKIEIVRTEDNFNDYCTRLYNNGLRACGTRHNKVFDLARWCKYILKINKDEAKEKLNKWTEINYQKGLVNNLDEAFKDNDKILRDIYDKNKYNPIQKVKTITFTKKEYKEVMKLKNNFERRIFLTLLTLGKMYNDHTFFATYDEIAKFAKMSKRNVVKYLASLAKKKNKIEIKQKGQYKKTSSIATVYHIPLLSSFVAEKQSIDISITDDITVNDLINILHDIFSE